MDRRLFPSCRKAALPDYPHRPMTKPPENLRRLSSTPFPPDVRGGQPSSPDRPGEKQNAVQGQILHSITNDSIVLVRTTRRRDVFLPPFSLHSAGSFLPCHRPSAGRGKGLASSPAACGRPSRYRQPAKVIRIFHEKWKKEGWFVPVERQETLLHTG